VKGWAPTSVASTGISLAAGLALGKMFTDQHEQGGDDPVARLQKLKQLLDEGIIMQEEFDSKKKEWLNRL
jgi:hypothetical protein